MIKHIVMWRLKESAAWCGKAENAQKLKEMLEALRERIPQIRRLEVGLNADPSDTASDVVLVSEFENREDLEVYQRHPDHLRVAEFVKQIGLERRVVDFLASPEG